MRRSLIWLATLAAAAAIPTASAAAVSPRVLMTIVHVVQGCHSWGKSDSTPLSTKQVVVLRKGSRVDIRINCPMDFRFSQLSGPTVALGDPVTHTGTVRTVTFPKPGVYVLRADNVQSSAEAGLQTLGPDNFLILKITVTK